MPLCHPLWSTRNLWQVHPELHLRVCRRYYPGRGGFAVHARGPPNKRLAALREGSHERRATLETLQRWHHRRFDGRDEEDQVRLVVSIKYLIPCFSVEKR